MNMQVGDMANYTSQQELFNSKEALNGHNDSRMVWFQAFRGEFGYSNFGEYRTSAIVDIQFVAIIYTCVLISVATLIVAAGIRGKERWYTLIRVIYSLAVGSVILVSLYGYCWQMGEINIRSPYIYRNDVKVDATLGIRVGLRTINLTLSGEYMDSSNTFRYNEEFELEKVLKSPAQMSEGLSRGLPSPLLFIVEHYDTDDGELRFGRSCFMAGYFASILLWAAFISWVTGTILLCSVIWYGAVLYILTGICMFMAAIIYDTLCTNHTIKTPYNDTVLKLSYGWCFWSTLVFGIVNTVIGIVVFALENKAPKLIAAFFQLDTPFEEHEDFKLFTTPPSRVPTVPNTPVPPIKVEKDSHLKPPMNWYVNYGYDVSKNNPVFIDTGNDTTPTPVLNGRDVTSPNDLQSTRKIDRITEEGKNVTGNSNGSSNKNSETDVNKLNGDTFDRLSEVYVDVEPTHRKENTVNHMFIQELDDAIEGK